MEKLNNNLLQQKLTSLPFRKIAPNIVTTLALCAGVTSMRYAIMGLWGKAIVCIFLAALFDMLDGRVARMLKGSTKFGAELDSLSDFVSFGVAPAILMYQWTLSSFPKFGWFFCLLFAICMAMRLARFNTMLEDEPQPVYYALEQVFNVIDSRYRSKKPLIITTNLTLSELNNAADIAHKRIYDRILELSLIHI